MLSLLDIRIKGTCKSLLFIKIFTHLRCPNDIFNIKTFNITLAGIVEVSNINNLEHRLCL